jgi:Fe-S oxidoreductase
MVPYSEKMLDIVYRCTMCGACDTNCRVIMGNMISNNEIVHAQRVRCVEDGQILPEHLVMVDNMRKEKFKNLVQNFSSAYAGNHGLSRGGMRNPG